MSRKDQLLRILFALDRHFDDDGISSADVDRWDELKRHVVRMKEGLELALGELVSGAPANEVKVRKALEHVRFGLGLPELYRKAEKPMMIDCDRGGDRGQRMKLDSVLRLLPTGEWAIQAPGREPVRIVEREVFMVEVGGKMKRTRLAQGSDCKYRSSTGLELRDGMRAGLYDQREWYAKIVPKQ